MRVLSAFLISSVVFLSFGSCSREFYEGEESYPRSTALSVSEARRYVESQLASRTRSSEASEWNTLTLGNYTADWSRAATSEGRALYSVDVPVTGEYVYYQVVDDSMGRPELLPMYHKLVVVKDKNCDSVGCYIRFYMPDLEPAFVYPASHFDSLLNSRPKQGFGGFAVYTTLRGLPVCAGQYREGIIHARAFLGDTLRTKAENWSRLGAVLNGARVARVSVGIATRADDKLPVDTTMINGGGIDPVPIDGVRPVIIEAEKQDKEGGVGGGWDDDDNKEGIPSTEPNKDDPSGGGGSGTGDNKDEDKPSPDSYVKNPKIKATDPKIVKLLEQIFDDCMGKLLIRTLSDEVTITGGGPEGEACLGVTPVTDSSGNWTSNKYWIAMGAFNDYSLLEELIHVFQYSGRNPNSVIPYKMNNEIESKLGWYMYLQRSDIVRPEEDYAHFLGGEQGLSVFKSLKNSYQLNDTSSANFLNMYENAVSLLRPGYPEDRYPYSRDRMRYPVLSELMKDCN